MSQNILAYFMYDMPTTDKTLHGIVHTYKE